MKLKKVLIIIAVVCLLCCLLVACNETIVVNGNDKTYDPTLVLSGDVLEIVSYSPISDKGLEWGIIELTEVLSKVKISGEIKNVTIFTHGQKSLTINASSIAEYYLVISANGVVRLYSRLNLHQEIGNLPLMSLSEIMISTTNGNGIKRIYDDKANIVDYNTFLRAYGMLNKVSEAVENDKYELTTYNLLTVSVSKLLTNHDSAVLKLKDGTLVTIDRKSTNKMHWSKGGLYLTTDYNSPIVEVDFRSQS